MNLIFIYLFPPGPQHLVRLAMWPFCQDVWRPLLYNKLIQAYNQAYNRIQSVFRTRKVVWTVLNVN